MWSSTCTGKLHIFFKGRAGTIHKTKFFIRANERERKTNKGNMVLDGKTKVPWLCSVCHRDMEIPGLAVNADLCMFHLPTSWSDFPSANEDCSQVSVWYSCSITSTLACPIHSPQSHFSLTLYLNLVGMERLCLAYNAKFCMCIDINHIFGSRANSRKVRDKHTQKQVEYLAICGLSPCLLMLLACQNQKCQSDPSYPEWGSEEKQL